VKWFITKKRNRIFTHDCELIVRWRRQLLTTSARQFTPWRRSSLDWSLSSFLSPFIRLFLTPPLKPCGYSTFLIMMQQVSFSPNLYTTARISPHLYTTALTVLRNVPTDLRSWRTCFHVLPVKMRYEIKIVCRLYARWDLILELSF
jgi:hypothetical protein